jgi:Glycosyl transferases group 1
VTTGEARAGKIAYLAAEVGLDRQQLRFVDRVPTWEVPLWIRACDLVTVPWPWSEFSAYVTCPLKLFEYMAAERPIVASDLPSPRQIVRHGQDAWLVEPGDLQRWPAALPTCSGRGNSQPGWAGRRGRPSRLVRGDGGPRRCGSVPTAADRPQPWARCTTQPFVAARVTEIAARSSVRYVGRVLNAGPSRRPSRA